MASIKVLLQLILVLLVTAVVAAAGFAWWMTQAINTPRLHNFGAKEIEIPEGATADDVFKLLQDHGIIDNAMAMKLYVKFTRDKAAIKAGYYLFNSPTTGLQVLQKLESGQQREDRITIIEGWTKWDIATALSKQPRLNTTKEAALKLLNDGKLIADLDPGAASLEGYLFPDTYNYGSSATAEELVKRMVTRFKEVWTKKFAAHAKAHNISCHNAVTIASIVETEAKLLEDRALVASVVNNRLKRNIPLAVDCTIIYASKLAGKWRNDGKVYVSDLERKSPYNSRLVTGLPPGPVGCPGVASLNAAVNPATSNYIFYVRNPDRNDGAHNFYSDAAEFEKGVAALRRWEERERAAGRR